MAKIIQYNVNGIRAALKKDWMTWIQAVDPDVVCIQETKAQEDQLDLDVFHDAGYKSYFHSAEKKGYSGVAILSKTEPDHIEIGCGIQAYDSEGRIIRADYGDFSVLSCYFPSGTTGDVRQAFKMSFLADFQDYINELKKTRPNLLVSGDVNICHTAIDIHNPDRNKDTSGFKPEERQWVTEFLESGFIDTFRHLNKEPHNYTWWSYRANARNNNKGWRLDYGMVNESLKDRLKRSVILSDAKHSDHCPILLEVEK